jgi:hypothetical protein
VPVIIEKERGAILQSLLCGDLPHPLLNKTKRFLALTALEILLATCFLVTLTAKTNCPLGLGFENAPSK